MTEPQQKQRIETGGIWVEDFTVSCRYPRSMLGGKSCPQNARWFVQLHRVGFCTHPSLEHGIAASFVCADHLEALEVESDRIVRRHNPPFWARLFNKRKPWCPSCGRQRIDLQSDVLQYAKEI